MFSANNSAVGVQSLNLSIAPLLRRPEGSQSTPVTVAGVSTLTAGQTVEIDIASTGGFMPELKFQVNGAVLASSTSGHLKTWFTVPYGMKALTLQASGQTAFGQAVSSAPSQIAIVPDQGMVLSGHAVDTGGRPAPGAVLTWQVNGLAADYYQFNQSLGGIPDVTGLTPARTGYISALNFPNPQQVFGADPMGVGLGQNYAIRFHGNLSIAAAGDYQLQLSAQSGGRIRIDGATVSDNAIATLTAGDHAIEVIYYQSGDAASAVQLLWTPPGGVQTSLPPSVLTTGAPVNAGSDGHFQFGVPAALTGVHFVIANGQGTVVLDQ
jgi:hypothetical protein